MLPSPKRCGPRPQPQRPLVLLVLLASVLLASALLLDCRLQQNHLHLLRPLHISHLRPMPAPLNPRIMVASIPVQRVAWELAFPPASSCWESLLSCSHIFTASRRKLRRNMSLKSLRLIFTRHTRCLGSMVRTSSSTPIP